ncbi:TRAP transporter small permease [Kyrpidia sp.]|uniref:TRAP transporter small permease n=1 Tax=Kyrpidia sp. TaxID=2073077 RepID=UPI00258A2504|nr:TRAP transporter small permease [Kyrpidia sp.]MCL6575705.1 TRAP transporter small permease [Kyrpidia sp.]
MRWNWIRNAEDYLSGAFFVGGMALSFYAVVTRYVFKSSPAWALEVFEFLMVWSIFLGFGMALRDNHHISVDLLYDRLPGGIRKIFDIISNFIGAAYSIFMTVTGVQITMLAYQQGIVTTDAGIPVWLTYLIMPIGMALLAIHFVLKLMRILRPRSTMEPYMVKPLGSDHLSADGTETSLVGRRK